MSTIQFAIESQLQDIDGGYGTFTLPGGYLDSDGVLQKEVLLRALSGAEEDLLGSRKVESSKKMALVLGSCIEKIGDITSKEAISRIMPDMLFLDMTYLFFAARIVSHGRNFPFKKLCGKDNCPPSIYTLDLAALEVFSMPNPEKRIYEIMLPSSKKTVTFRPLLSKDEARRESLQSRVEPLTLSLLLRVEDIDGRSVSANDIVCLPVHDRDELRAAIEDVEGGIDTEVELKCPICGREFTSDVDPSDPAFFSPSVTRSRWKRKSSF